MQAFMQSLQMRCPVAAQIGLSTVTMARAPRLLPRAFTRFISEIFSSSGQPARATPKTLLLKARSEEHTSELQSQSNLVCRLLLEKKKKIRKNMTQKEKKKKKYNRV